MQQYSCMSIKLLEVCEGWVSVIASYQHSDERVCTEFDALACFIQPSDSLDTALIQP